MSLSVIVNDLSQPLLSLTGNKDVRQLVGPNWRLWGWYIKLIEHQ